jgi:hypothetical protein
MKRDIDLIRQLLFELERHDADCPPDALAISDGRQNEERIRYHLKLLVDAGLAKETNRTSGGQPCLRLTCAGHELLDLCRSETRWREAKRVVWEQTGALSLNVLRALLTKWAVQSVSQAEPRRRWRRIYRPAYERDRYHEGPAYRVESYRYEREPLLDDEVVQVVRSRPAVREPIIAESEWRGERSRNDDLLDDEPFGVSLPVHMI